MLGDFSFYRNALGQIRKFVFSANSRASPSLSRLRPSKAKFLLSTHSAFGSPRTKFVFRPHGDSNLDFRLRRPALYPLSYGDKFSAGEGCARFVSSTKPRAFPYACTRSARLARMPAEAVLRPIELRGQSSAFSLREYSCFQDFSTNARYLRKRSDTV